MATNRVERLGFGGGCHWCTEAVFQALRGVHRVEQGFIKSSPPHDTFSEAVIVEFCPTVISWDVLIDVHILTHASGSDHKMRGKYRSAVYVFNDQQSQAARSRIELLRHDRVQPIITRVLPLAGFRKSDDRFRDYYRKDPERPFCVNYIDPKLRRIREQFGNYCAKETLAAGSVPSSQVSQPSG